MAASMNMVLPGCALAILLSIAVWYDVRTRKIPNRLVFFGTLIGVALNIFLPAGTGIFSDPPGALGFLPSLIGVAVGLATLIPMYALGAMGAGDVKLMAMVGAFLGPEQILGVALLSLLAGGVLALAVALWTRTLARVLHNTCSLLLDAIVRAVAGTGVRIDKPATPTSKLAYAIAIMSGTGLDIILTRTNGWSLLS
jgi:prepilin peptidase CpaA